MFAQLYIEIRGKVFENFGDFVLTYLVKFSQLMILTMIFYMIVIPYISGFIGSYLESASSGEKEDYNNNQNNQANQEDCNQEDWNQDDYEDDQENYESRKDGKVKND